MKFNKKTSHIIRALISVIAIVVIFKTIDFEISTEIILTASLLLLLFSIVITFLELIIISLKWKILLNVNDFKISTWRLITINLISSFWGLFLPSSLSIDVLRGFYLVKDESSKALSASSIVVDRVLGTLSLLFIAVFGVGISGTLLKDFNIGIYIGIIVGLSLLGIIVVMNDKVFNVSIKHLSYYNNNFLKKVCNLYKVVHNFKAFPKTLFYSFLLSLLVQVLRIVGIYYISEAYSLNIDIIYFFIIVPISMITVMIPISVGGIGVREGSFIAFFALVGLQHESAVLISVTLTLKMILFSLIGGGLYLLYKPNLKVYLSK